jgi:hypothetical protein
MPERNWSNYGGYPQMHGPYASYHERPRQPSYSSSHRHPSYSNRAPPSHADYHPDTFHTLRVRILVKRGSSGSISLKLHSWVGKDDNVALEEGCKRYILREIKQSVLYEEDQGRLKVRIGAQDRYTMNFRINKLHWNDSMGRITVLKVQPDIYSFTRAKLRR